jgi:hypothetical protein
MTKGTVMQSAVAPSSLPFAAVDRNARSHGNSA